MKRLVFTLMERTLYPILDYLDACKCKALAHRLKAQFRYIGVNVSFDPKAYFSSPALVSIGSYTCISPGGIFVGDITIGENVSIGPNLHIRTVNHRYEQASAIPYDRENVCKPVVIHDHVWIGADVCIGPGVTIGEGAVVGFGAVVTRDVEAGHIVGGNPAKTLKQRDMSHFEQLKQAGCWINKTPLK
jgi:maltose O-acetyltransferase